MITNKLTDPLYQLMFLAMGGGAIAGAGMAGFHILRGRKATLLMLLAYVVVGAVTGLSHYLIAPMVGIHYTTGAGLLRGSIFVSVLVLLVIAGRDIGFRMTINRFGWKGRVEFFRPSSKKDGDGKE